MRPSFRSSPDLAASSQTDRGNGKEHGNYRGDRGLGLYRGRYRSYIGIMEKKMETTGLWTYRGYMGILGYMFDPFRTFLSAKRA